MKNINNTSKLICLLLLFVSVFSATCYANEYKPCNVSDRELMLLSYIAYSNEQKEDITEMTNTRLSIKPFCDYASLSELEGWKNVDSSHISMSLYDNDGFSALCYKKDNNVVIAFRGTDSNIFLENMSYLIPYNDHVQAKHAAKYIDFVASSNFIDKNTKIYLCGHSLGGYLAMYATPYVLVNNVLKDGFVKTVTFNGLNIGRTSNIFVVNILKSLSTSQIVKYRIRGDIISSMSKSYNPQTTLPLPYWYIDLIPKKMRCKLGNHSISYFFPLIKS